MNLVDILAQSAASAFHAGTVQSHADGLTVLFNGASIGGVPYLYSVPPIGSIVLLVYVGDQLVCLGPFASPPRGIPPTPVAPASDKTYDARRTFTATTRYNG